MRFSTVGDSPCKEYGPGKCQNKETPGARVFNESKKPGFGFLRERDGDARHTWHQLNLVFITAFATNSVTLVAVTTRFSSAHVTGLEKINSELKRRKNWWADFFWCANIKKLKKMRDERFYRVRQGPSELEYLFIFCSGKTFFKFLACRLLCHFESILPPRPPKHTMRSSEDTGVSQLLPSNVFWRTCDFPSTFDISQNIFKISKTKMWIWRKTSTLKSSWNKWSESFSN